MNVTVIPFFLAANLIVNDMSNWKFGPEYSYNMSIIYDTKLTPNNKTYKTTNFNSTVQCRPKDPEILFCRLNNISGTTDIRSRKIIGNIDSEKAFGIKFNEHGVEALLVESVGEIRILNIIRQIANQFNVNVNLIHKNNNGRPMPQFMEKENTSMGNCMTTYEIKHGEHQPNILQKRDTNFQLKVLAIPILKPGINFSISKNRKECTDGPENPDIMLNAILKMERYDNTIWIDNTYKTFTEINGYIYPKKKLILNRTYLYKETIELNLDSIKPAQDELPSTSNWQMIDLNIKVIPD